MLREQVRQVLRRLRRVLRMERRLNIEELCELAEAISHYAQMIQSREKWSAQPPLYVILEISELADRFRHPPRTIKDALLVLNLLGVADPLPRRRQYWKVKPADTPGSRGRLVSLGSQMDGLAV